MSKSLLLIIDLIPFKHGLNFWVHQFVTVLNEIEEKRPAHWLAMVFDAQ